MTPLSGKWALVTGAASGIGLATAKAFARRRANVVLTDVNEKGLSAADDALKGEGARRLVVPCDVADDRSVASLGERVAEAGITPDVLVNNAGVAFLGGFLETPIDEWRRALEINLLGAVRMTRAFLPAMRSAGGPRSIVNVASVAAVLPPPNLSAYAASKGAVRQFSEVLAMELASTDVRVHCIYPGIINTPIVGGAARVGANISAEQLATLQAYYAGRGGSPDAVGEDIVRAVLRGEAHVFTGPKAAVANWAARISPALARRVSLAAAKESGYLPAGG